MEPVKPTYIQLTPAALRNALFGWDEHWGEPCRSVTLNEPESFYPRRVPVAVAQVIQKHDPEGELFKVFIYPTHAEVWHALQWAHSASCKHAKLLASAVRLAEHNKRVDVQRAEFEQLQRTKNILLKHYPIWEHANARALLEFCRFIQASAPDADIFKQFPNLTEIHQHEQTRREDSGAETSAHPCQ